LRVSAYWHVACPPGPHWRDLGDSTATALKAKARAEAKALKEVENGAVLVELVDDYVGMALLGEDAGET
jgi:hypothetical protein